MTEELPDIEVRDGHLIYPMPDDARLGNFDRFDFYYQRFMRSDFYRDCITERREAAGFYGVALWCHAMAEAPVGTIPDDDKAQAYMVGLGADLRRWRAVANDALHGFLPVMRPCGRVIEGRRSRMLLLQVAYGGWLRDQKFQEGKRVKALAARRGRLAGALGKLIPGDKFFDQPDMADYGLAFIAAHGLAVNPANARRAKAAIADGWEPPREADVIPMRGAG